MTKTIQNIHDNKWKYISFALMAVIAVPAVSSVAMPQAFADITNNVNHMLSHIYNFVDGIEAKTNNLPSDPASNTQVNTRATQTSVDNLQTTANAIKAKTDNLPSDPASNSHIDEAIGSISSGGLTEEQFNSLKCNGPLQPGVDMSGCDFSGLFLSHEDRVARLSGADFHGANFNGASLRGADLRNADLHGADFNPADFTDADLRNADLHGADLTDAYLGGADLSNADMSFTFLDGVNFDDADLRGTDFTGCTGNSHGTPEFGSLPTCFIG